MLFWMLVIFLIKFLETYLVRMGTFTTLTKRESWSMILDALDESLGLLALAILVVDLFYLPYSLSYVIGSMIATKAVARRWPSFVWRAIRKKKNGRKNYKKRTPFSTA